MKKTDFPLSFHKRQQPQVHARNLSMLASKNQMLCKSSGLVEWRLVCFTCLIGGIAINEARVELWVRISLSTEICESVVNHPQHRVNAKVWKSIEEQRSRRIFSNPFNLIQSIWLHASTASFDHVDIFSYRFWLVISLTSTSKKSEAGIMQKDMQCHCIHHS